MKYDTAAPYIASYLYFKKDGKTAFIKRQNTGWMDGYYGFPAGKVEKNEAFTQAAVREAKEEVGIDLKPENLRQVLTVHRHTPDMDWIDAIFEVIDWEGELFNAEPHMHGELVWLNLAELPENIVPVNRFIIEQITAGNHYAEYGWDS